MDRCFVLLDKSAMKTLRERLLFLLDLRHITQTEATEKGGFKNTAFINDIIREHKHSVTGKNLVALAKAFDTSEAFLLGQTDDPEPGATATVKKEPKEPFPSLPEFDIRAGTSYGGGTDTLEWAENGVSGHQAIAAWGFPKPFVENELGLSFGFADVIPIAGDSMDDGTRDALVSGDRVIIDRKSQDVRQGGIFAVWDGEGVIIKQVELVRGAEMPTIICKSRNPRYDPISLHLDDNVHVIGRVAGKISRV